MNGMPFSLSDGVNNMLTNFKNGTWALIDDVPTNETVALTVDYPEEFDTVCQSSTAASAGNCFMKNPNKTGLRAGLFGSRNEKYSITGFHTDSQLKF